MPGNPQYAGGQKPSKEYSFGWSQQKKILAQLNGETEDNLSQLTDMKANGGRGSPGRGADVGIVNGGNKP